MNAAETPFSWRDQFDGMTTKMFIDFYRKTQEHLIENLNKLGFSFNSEEELNLFFKTRVTRIYFSHSKRNEFYVDYVDNENKGTFIAAFTEISFESKNNQL